MTEVIKPIPDSILHEQSDEALTYLARFQHECISNGNTDIGRCKKILGDIYKVLGYRCALEYVQKYSH